MFFRLDNDVLNNDMQDTPSETTKDKIMKHIPGTDANKVSSLREQHIVDCLHQFICVWSISWQPLLVTGQAYDR